MTVVRGNAVKLTVVRLPFLFLISTPDFRSQPLNYFHRIQMSRVYVLLCVLISL